MQISSVTDNSYLDGSNTADSSATQTDKKNSASSFASHFTQASSQAGPAKAASSDDDGLQQFLQYAKETPAQRMFDNWLSSQHITMAQFNSMSTAAKEKLTQQFEQYMKETMQGSVAGTSNSVAAAASA
jgi:hypothetical protein